MAISVSIEIDGNNLAEVGYAIDEAKRRIMDGNHTGFDSSDDGRFSFTVSGEEEFPKDEED